MGRNFNIFLMAILTILACALPKNTCAEPLGFRRTRTTFALGLDVFDTVTGNFAKYSDLGMAAFAETNLQIYGFFGINLKIGSARAFTTKEFLPFDNGYQFIYFTLAPRFNYAPFRKLNFIFYLQPEIAMNILASNTLVAFTDNREITGAAGGAIGLQMIFGILSVALQFSTQYNWVLETAFLSGSIAIGVSSTIQ